jgi:tetratricopeptide (TPR) repeat protein
VADSTRIEELRRRIAKDPASIAFAQLAEEYRRSGENDEAVRVCRTGLAKHPSYLSARVTLGRALIELEQYDEAHTELEYVLRSAPENLAAIRGLAEIHQRRGELGEALKQYQTALGIAKHDPELEEAVEALTRQLGGAPASDAGAPPATTLPDGTAVFAPMTALPVDVPTLPVETFEPAPDPTTIALSPELEAAADEFTRALEALDAISIDVPTPPLPTESFEIPPIPMPDDDHIVAAHDWEAHAEAPVPIAADASTPDAEAIADLQNWLDNIVLDKGVKANHS